MQTPADRIKAFKRRYRQLVQRRDKMVPLWKELRDYVNPERFEFGDESRDAGDNLYSKIYNNTPVLAAETLAAGMMTHHTSPSTIWFDLEVEGVTYSDLDQQGQIWLADLRTLYMLIFARSNIYMRMSELYEDLATPGTAVMFTEEDREDGIRGWVLPCGSYCLATGANGRVNTLYRETKLTIAQMVERFGYDSCSRKVRELFDRGEFDQERKILHIVEPRELRDPEKVDALNMAWASYWLELEGSDTEGFLRESGYRSCPFQAPRWSIFGNDPYGRSSAMRALGDAKELQTLELEKAKLVQKISRPPMAGPSELDGKPVELVPDGFTSISGDGRLAPAYVPDRAALAEVRQDIALCELRINRAFHADLFRTFTDDDRANNKTAEEIKAKRNEQLTLLGPVVQRLDDEWLDPFFSRVFDIVQELNLLPPPPESLQGRELRVTFISVLASAQRMLRTTSLERLTNFALNLGQADPAAVGELSAPRIMRLYAEMVGADPRALKSDEERAQEAEAQARAAEQAQAAEQLQAATQSVKNLATAPMGQDNALGAALQALGPMATTGVGGPQ